MSKIVVFGAGGTVRRMITDEATRRGHTVTAVVRDRSDVLDFAEGVNTVTGDPTDSRSVRALAKGEDVFIVAVGGADNTVWLRAAQTLVETLAAIPRHDSANSAHGRGIYSINAPRRSFLRSAGFPRSLSRSCAGAGGGAGLLSRPRQWSCFLDIPFTAAGLFRARSAHRQVSHRARPSR